MYVGRHLWEAAATANGSSAPVAEHTPGAMMPGMGMRWSTEGARLALGVAIANTILLVYGLFRPESVEFSLAFLVAPSLALLWTVVSGGEQADRRRALWVTWGSVAAAVAVVIVNWLRE
jgi:hypothetical protein